MRGPVTTPGQQLRGAARKAAASRAEPPRRGTGATTRVLDARNSRAPQGRATRPAYRPLWLRHIGSVAMFAAVLCACESGAPKVLGAIKEEPLMRSEQQEQVDLAELTEAEKIARLLHEIRASGLVFIRNDREHTSGEAADHLQFKLDKAGGRVETAQQFIDHVASASSFTGEAYLVRTSDGTEMPAGRWLGQRLRELEQRSAEARARKQASVAVVNTPLQVDVAADGPAAPSISDALTLVQASKLDFIAPQRNDKVKVYTGPQFARMLRNKWHWLGRDIDNLDVFLDQIADESFSSLEPYMVRLPDGEKEPFNKWMRRQLLVDPNADEPAEQAQANTAKTLP